MAIGELVWISLAWIRHVLKIVSYSPIDQLVDATVEHELLSFMGAYYWYNQISMYLPDKEHTLFITDHRLYCYKVMPFGLKNAGATYQRLMSMMFVEQIRKIMEVYVDNMLVKSQLASQYVSNLEEMSMS